MATKANTYSPGDININNFTLGEVKQNDYGGKFVNILYKDEKGSNHIPYMRTGSYMKLPFGISETSFDDNSVPKCSVSVDFTGKDTDEKIMDTYNLFNNLDNLLLKWGLENGKQWFKKPNISAEIINDKYSPMIKVPRDKDGEVNEKYEKSVRFNLSKNKTTDEIVTKIFDHKKKLVENPREYIKPRMSARLVIKPKFIWINATGFGLSWEVNQMKLSEPINEDECAFTDESDSENECDAVNADEADNAADDDNNEEIFDFDSQLNDDNETNEIVVDEEAIQQEEVEKPKKKGGRKSKK